MNHFFTVTVLLGFLSLAFTANFSLVYEWPDELDYEWPSEANRTQALKDKTFKPENIIPRYMAVYGTRIFLSLYKDEGIPANLVSLPTTSSASSASPKLTPVPSWDMHKYGNCDKIEEARGLEIDSVGRLWVLDDGSDNCNAKIWTIDLSKNDQTKLIHQFPFHGLMMHDMVIDETPNGTFAYITRRNEQHIVVFSLERNLSWLVYTPGMKFFSIALSPIKDQEPRQLYLSKSYSYEVYSISVAILRNGTGTANPKLIGKWTAINSYRMLMDTRGTMYATFWGTNYIQSWNTSWPFQEQRFHEVQNMNTILPFTFALDSSATFWLTVFNDKGTKPRCSLIKTAVGVKPYHITDSTVTERSNLSIPITTQSSTPDEEHRLLNIILIFSNVFSIVLLSIVIIWLVLKLKRKNSLSQNTNEAQQMSVLPDDPAEYDDVGPAEVPLYEEVKYDQAAARPPSPGLYEPPIRLSPRSARRVKAMPERPRTFEEFGEAPRAPLQFEYDYVRTAEPEPLYDEVAPEPSTMPPFDDAATSESAQYLKVLP